MADFYPFWEEPGHTLFCVAGDCVVNPEITLYNILKKPLARERKHVKDPRPSSRPIFRKCPKCGGGVAFYIKEIPYNDEKRWTGHCEYCGQRYLHSECSDLPPVPGSGADLASKK